MNLTSRGALLIAAAHLIVGCATKINLSMANC